KSVSSPLTIEEAGQCRVELHASRTRRIAAPNPNQQQSASSTRAAGHGGLRLFVCRQLVGAREEGRRRRRGGGLGGGGRRRRDGRSGPDGSIGTGITAAPPPSGASCWTGLPGGSGTICGPVSLNCGVTGGTMIGGGGGGMFCADSGRAPTRASAPTQPATAAPSSVRNSRRRSRSPRS